MRAPRLGGLGGWLLVAVAAVGMFASTPSSAGPDEPMHEATAWYVSSHGVPPAQGEHFLVPTSLWVSPCFGGHPETGAGCMPPRSANGGTVLAGTVYNYPPVYYLVVGFGERIAALAGRQYADVGGRIASALLSFGTLFLLSLYMRRRHPLWGSFLLLLSTPMAVFLGVVVNPSGWEITCGIALAAVLAEAAWTHLAGDSGPPIASDVLPRATAILLVLASLGLCLARPLGFVWAIGLTASAIVLSPTVRPRLYLRIGGAVAPGVAAGVLWMLTHPYKQGVMTPDGVVMPSTIRNLVDWFSQSLLRFPDRLHQMFGVLGWLDTAMPQLLVVATIAVWAVLLTRLPSVRKTAVLIGVVGIWVLPGVVEAAGWGAWPAWWQGRYTLPFALGFVMLLVLRSGRLIPRTVSAAAAFSALSLGTMVLVNTERYAFGLTAVELPASLTNPGLGVGRLVVSLTAGAILLLARGYLAVQAWMRKPDLRPRLEPDSPATPR